MPCPFMSLLNFSPMFITLCFSWLMKAFVEMGIKNHEPKINDLGLNYK